MGDRARQAGFGYHVDRARPGNQDHPVAVLQHRVLCRGGLQPPGIGQGQRKPPGERKGQQPLGQLGPRRGRKGNRRALQHALDHGLAQLPLRRALGLHLPMQRRGVGVGAGVAQ